MEIKHSTKLFHLAAPMSNKLMPPILGYLLETNIMKKFRWESTFLAMTLLTTQSSQLLKRPLGQLLAYGDINSQTDLNKTKCLGSFK